MAQRYGDDVMSRSPFPRSSATSRRITRSCSTSSTDGDVFHPFALFGFKEGQNLFLGPERLGRAATCRSRSSGSRS